jgi:hypothetical protein
MTTQVSLLCAGSYWKNLVTMHFKAGKMATVLTDEATDVTSRVKVHV